jgi:iron complex outermembrane receptor protein
VDISWFKQTGNTIADYARSKNTDFTSLGIRGEDDSSTSTWPFSVDLSAAEATTAGLKTGAGWYVATGGVPQSSPSVSQFTFIGSSKNNATDANRFNYAPFSQIIPDQNNWDLLFKATHDFNPNITGFATILSSDNQTHILYTPNSVNSTSTTVNNASDLTAGLTPTYLSLPANNPYNPFGSLIGGSSSSTSSFIGRVLFGPTRTYDVESRADNFLTGLDGRVGSDWTWDLTLSYGSDLVTDNANDNIRAADMQAALNGTLAGYQGSFLNPFGLSANQAMVNSLFVTSDSTAKDNVYDGEFSATGPLFSLPYLPEDHGKSQAVSLAAGGEWRHEQLTNDPDTTNYVVIPVSSTPFSAGRSITSEFLEIDAPVAGKYLELQAAARHDDYNQFGGTTNPKFAAVSEPLSFLKLRASYSQSFKAPDLGQLYNEPLTTYSSTQTLDPLNPLVPAQPYAQLTGGNPNLKPEKGKVYYLGGVIDLDSAIKGLSFSVDHYAINLSNVISTFSTPAQLETLFPNLVVRGAPTAQAPNGPIQYFDYVPINAAAYYWRGFDLGAHYKIPTTPIGKFVLDVEATRVMYFAYDAGTGQGPINKAGQYNATGGSPGATPRWTGTIQTGWSKGQTSASLAMVYKGPWDDNANAPTAVWGENPITLFNGTVSYKIPSWRSKLTLGCDNIFNTPPPPNAYASPSDGFDISTYGAWALGRFVSLKITKDF